MIAEFTVENFRSIRERQTLSFIPTPDSSMAAEYLYEVRPGVGLLKLGILYGTNASGKSNLLEALDLFRFLMVCAPESKTAAIPYEPFMLDNESRHRPTAMSMTFYAESVKYKMSLKYNQTKVLEEKLEMTETGRPAKVYDRTYDAENDKSEVVFGTKLKLAKKERDALANNTIPNCTVLAAFGKTNLRASALNKVFLYFSDTVNTLLTPNLMLSSFVKGALKQDNDGELKSFLLEILKRSDFNICNFSMHEEFDTLTPMLQKAVEVGLIPMANKDEALKSGTYKHDELTFEHMTPDGEFSLPEESESDGTIRFMGIGVILKGLLSGNAIITIDEIESSVHFELIAYLLKLFLANGRKPSQLLFSTHDITLLSERFIRRDTVWFTDKNEGGNTELRRMSDMGLHKTISPYNAYRQGKLGKLPLTGSNYLNKGGNGDGISD